MKTKSQSFGIQAALFICAFLGGCSDSSVDQVKQETQRSGHPGFSAKVSGAVNAEVSGAGIVTYLHPRDRGSANGVRPGYFLIANLNTDTIENQGLNLAFRIPDDAEPGNYNLTTEDPLKVGENFDVRVETVQEGKPMVYEVNTEGTIHLDDFMPNRTYPDTSTITGTFQFVTENSEGQKISAEGVFDFPLARKVVSLDRGHFIEDRLARESKPKI